MKLICLIQSSLSEMGVSVLYILNKDNDIVWSLSSP